MTAAATALHAAQRWMQEALLLPRRAGGEAAAAMLAGGGRLGRAEGLAVYQRAFVRRLASCMRAQFPALCHALGAQLFDDFVADYVRALPPESHTLHDLGRRFPAWLEESRPDAGLPDSERESWIDFMVDLARYERLVFTLFDAPGAEGRPLAGLATPDDRLRLQPCLALAAFRFDAPAYYHSVRQGREATLPAARPTRIALVRTDYRVRTLALSEADHLFLEGLAAGGVESGIAALARHLGLAAEDVRAAWRTAPGGRRRWIAQGLFLDGGESA